MSKDERKTEYAIQSAKPCTRDLLGEDVYKLSSLVQFGRGLSKWPPSHDLSTGSANIVISTSEMHVLFSNNNNRAVSSDFYRAFQSQSQNNVALTCLGAVGDNGQPAAVIKKLPKRAAPEKLDFLFVYPGTNNSLVRDDVDLNAVAKVVGKFLYVEAGKRDKHSLMEIQRTIVHEGVHFFGQNEILGSSPKGGDQGFSSRQFLIAKYRENIDFRASVVQELCVGKELLEAIFIDTKNSREEVKTLLIKMIKIGNDRRDNSTINVKDAEEFWYLVEGIPQYLDHEILIRNGAKGALIDLFRPYCMKEEYNTSVFYPLLAGAAIAHGLDFVLGSREAWQGYAKFDRMGPSSWMVFLKYL